MKLSKDLIVRLVLSIVTLINAIAAICGWTPLDIDEGMIYNLVSAASLVGIGIWGFWKNNNFTQAARISQDWLNELKGKDYQYNFEEANEVQEQGADEAEGLGE